MTFKRFLFTFCATACLTVAQQSHAQNSSDSVQGTLAACVSGKASSQDGESLLASLGWEPIERAELRDDTILAYAARTMLLYHSNMPAAPNWANSWERTKFNSSGERRKKSVKVDDVFFQVYQRSDDPSLIEVAEDARGKQARKTCQIILSSSISAPFAASLPAPDDLPTAIYTFPTQNLPNGTLQLSVYDQAWIESAVGEDFPFLAYLSVVSK